MYKISFISQNFQLLENITSFSENQCVETGLPGFLIIHGIPFWFDLNQFHKDDGIAGARFLYLVLLTCQAAYWC